jgi:hypothetical protein
MHRAVLFSFSLFSNGLLSTNKKDEQAARLFYLDLSRISRTLA